MMPTRIEWVRNPDGSPGETWNPVVGCSPCSPGCANCYAAKMAARLAGIGADSYGRVVASGGWSGDTALVRSALDKPLRWRKPRAIFTCSMGDLFHESVPDEWIDRVFAVVALAPRHTFMVLTKRPERMQKYFGADPYMRVRHEADEGTVAEAHMATLSRFDRERVARAWWTSLSPEKWPLKNLRLGVTVCNQEEADAKIPLLLDTPAAVRFVSYEPALGPVDFRNFLKMPWMPDRIVKPDSIPSPDRLEYIPVIGLDWLIAGGETGPGARPAHPDWFRSARDQCAAAGVPFFFKGWGAWTDTTTATPSERAALNSTESRILLPSGEVIGAGYREGRKSEGTVDTEWREKGAAWMERSRKRAGRLLDGRTHEEMPK